MRNILACERGKWHNALWAIASRHGGTTKKMALLGSHYIFLVLISARLERCSEAF